MRVDGIFEKGLKLENIFWGVNRGIFGPLNAMTRFYTKGRSRFLKLSIIFGFAGYRFWNESLYFEKAMVFLLN